MVYDGLRREDLKVPFSEIEKTDMFAEVQKLSFQQVKFKTKKCFIYDLLYGEV